MVQVSVTHDHEPRTLRGNPLSAAGHYFFNVINAVDQLGNALAAGNPDETMSSRLSREDIIPLLGPIVRAALNVIQKDHTTRSNEYDDLGLPDPHHLPSLGRAALASVLGAGDDYLGLPAALLKMAEEDALLQRLRECGMVNCPECGRYV